MRFFLKFIIISLGVSCNTSSDEKDSLILSQRLNLSEHINQAKSIYLYDSLLLVTDPSSGYLFKVFNINNDQFINEFGKIGNGPCEVNFPSPIINMNNESIALFNKKSLEIVDFPIEYLFSSGQQIADCENRKFKVDINFQKIIELNRAKIIGIGLFDKKYTQFSSHDGKGLRSYFSYHYEDELLGQHSYNTIAMASQGDLLKRPDGEKIVFASRNFGSIDILSVNDTIPILEHRKTITKPIFSSIVGDVIKANFSKENLLGFLSTAVSNQYIYGLYSGYEMGDNIQGSQLVIVYDWNGNKVREIILDQRVDLIAVKYDDSFLIGYLDDGKANIFQFKL